MPLLKWKGIVLLFAAPNLKYLVAFLFINFVVLATETILKVSDSLKGFCCSVWLIEETSDQTKPC